MFIPVFFGDLPLRRVFLKILVCIITGVNAFPDGILEQDDIALQAAVAADRVLQRL